MTSCTVPSISTGSVTTIGGITFNAGVSDTNLYLWLSDTAQGFGNGLDAIAASSIVGNSCTLASSGAGLEPGITPIGIAAANNKLYAVGTNGSDVLQEFILPVITTFTTNVIDSGASFGTQAVGVSPDGISFYDQFGAKKRVDDIAFGGTTESYQVGLAGMTDSYPGGLTVDTSGNVYANDTTSATFGTNGGIDVFTSALSETNRLHLASPLSQAGPSGALQNIAVGPYGTSSAVYAATAAGIEVFAFPLASSVAAPTETIVLPATPVSVITVADGREWVLFNDGTIEALPPN